MFRKIITISTVILLLILAPARSAIALDKTTKEAKRATKIKTVIAKRGIGPEARIKVKLKDGTKLKGYVSEISDDSFTVTDPETGTSTEVPYPSAKQVRGNGLTDNQMLFITFGALIGVVIITAIVKSGNDKTFGKEVKFP